MLIDTHAHIYSGEFDSDRKEMLERAFNAGVDQILMPAIDKETHASQLALQTAYPGKCLSMMGLHPVSVKEDFRNELRIAEEFLKQGSFIAIGETGLDYYWDLSFKQQQLEAFEQQAQWAVDYHIPIVIHSRESTDDCIAVIKKYTPKGLRGVFHCFSGTLEQAKTIIAEGFYLGIGGVLTFKKSGLDAVLKELSLDHILLETDAPYLAPVPYRGKRNEPAYVVQVAQRLADIKEMPLNDLAAITTANAKKLFAL
ncbi:hydrolase TatD [Niabella ginsenosidivorans]|uniref:Hydrolase TatD n=1 Tax=Niabella ginsenosidivorans TaxID=1176587 RepID=A0A1A9I412_9BACT|nr:TatD family hydrolase [Niabella ginsenosidivorans]ANH82366.1 hydrolase TatD [Niabella ginsenosidivorans]